MQSIWQKYKWIPQTVLGSAVFAAGFAFFLQPNDLSPGGISGLALLLVEVLGFGSVGVLSILMNLPLFILGGLKIGRQFFLGSLLGMILSSLLIDGFAVLQLTAVEPVIAMIYGGVLCGIGLGIVFVGGTSTGGSDILVRLLKLKYRNVPIGQIALSFDAVVVLLTGLVFQDMNKALYTGITVWLCGKMVDAVVYRFSELLKERRMAWYDLAIRAGVTPSSVYSMLDPRRKEVSVNLVKKLCDGLDMTLGEVFSTKMFDELEQEIK